MILLFVVLFLAAYVPAVAWAARGGPRRLARMTGGVLVLLLAAALVLGYRYSVPSVPRLLLFALAFVGPAIVLPALLLWPRAAIGGAGGVALGLSLFGAMAGLLAGWVIVVYGLRVW
jgi:hypothetical protein